MIPEIGQFALIIALCVAVLLSVVPAVGVWQNNIRWMNTARSLALGQLVFLAVAFMCLVIVFLQDDFSVLLAASHSNSTMPDFYKVSAVWGNHEGSLVLWMLILAVWTLAVAMFSRDLPLNMVARVLSIMGMISVGFLLFSILTSNPFERILPTPPPEGRDLNPLLQDPGLIIHPPMLYFGYVGFSVAFSFAVAALSSGNLDAAWARWSRPWTNIAWAFLTVGILLGSWWAYNELGWGGWWFWDPVENASFMPWIVGTALVHSLAVTEKRGMFKSWTVLLAIFAFSLSLLGTFLVRSGVLTSVHSFAADPSRGIFVLTFLAVVVGGSLTLYAFRAPTVVTRKQFGKWARELLLLINNVVLLAAALTVLFGTLFPLIVDAMGHGKYSVGPPYFNAVFVPLMAILMAMIGIGPASQWKKTEAAVLRRRLMVAAIASLLIGVAFPFAYHGEFNAAIVLAITLVSWVVLTTLVDIKHKARNAPTFVQGVRRLPIAYWGMVFAHIGFAIAALGICVVSHYTDERDVGLVPGESIAVAGYDFTFASVRHLQGPNFDGDEGVIEVRQDGELLSVLHPQKRRYLASGQVMTESDVDVGLFRDLYVAMGEPLGADAWSIRVHYKPFVRFMWLGGLIMAFGGVLAITDKRYRASRKIPQPQIQRTDAELGSAALS